MRQSDNYGRRPGVGGIKTTPAMVAGLTHRVWTVEEVLARMDPNRLLH